MSRGELKLDLWTKEEDRRTVPIIKGISWDSKNSALLNFPLYETQRSVYCAVNKRFQKEKLLYKSQCFVTQCQIGLFKTCQTFHIRRGALKVARVYRAVPSKSLTSYCTLQCLSISVEHQMPNRSYCNWTFYHLLPLDKICSAENSLMWTPGLFVRKSCLLVHNLWTICNTFWLRNFCHELRAPDIQNS